MVQPLRADIIVAMKARDGATATILRTADAAIQRASMDASAPIDDTLVLGTLRKVVKNLSDARADFEKGGRPELAAANAAEIAVLEKYLPAQIEGARLESLVAAAITESGAQSRKEMGRVIGILKKSPDAARIDFGAVDQ